MPEFHIEMCGVPICFTSAEPRIIAVFSDYFHYYRPQVGAAQARADELRVELRLTQALPPPHAFAPPKAEFMAEAGTIKMWREAASGEERFYFHTGASAYGVWPERGLLEGFITPAALDSPHLLANTYTLFPLLLLLRWRARYYLHTAAVLSPQGRLYLICGGQRAGKSTFTTALGLAGWRPIADDSLLLCEAGEAVEMFAFKRDFHLSVELLRQWPELNEITQRHFYFDRATVAGLEFFGTRTLADVPRARAHTVLFPQITGEAESRLEPVAASEAILTLTDQSMFLPLWREHTARQMRLLMGLVKGAAFYRLLSGKDVWRDPRMAARVLEALERH